MSSESIPASAPVPYDIDPAWRPTARSEHGRKVPAARHRQVLIEAIHQWGRDLRLDPEQVLAAMSEADAELHARGQHPDDFAFGDPVDDFVEGMDADYDEP